MNKHDRLPRRSWHKTRRSSRDTSPEDHKEWEKKKEQPFLEKWSKGTSRRQDRQITRKSGLDKM
eukprot:5232245-Amphidinium_carterae.1